MKKLVALLFSLLLLGIDQLTKWIVVNTLSEISTYPLIQDVLHLTYVENRGMAFGLFPGEKWLLIGVTGVLLIGLAIVGVKEVFPGNMALFSIAAIVGGGVGNLIDRAFRGFVVDFVDFRLIHFWVFNFADSCICIGVLFFVISYLSREIKLEKEKRAKGQNNGRVSN